MSLPETIWRCWENIVFGERQADDWTPYLVQPHFCKPKNGHKDCGPIRVAGRDDLLIRREDYDAAVERAYQMFRSWLVEDNDAPLRSAVKAALAAAEGGEGA